ERRAEGRGVAHAAGTDDREAEVRQLLVQRTRIARARVTACLRVDRDQTMNARVASLHRPLALGHVVIDEAARALHAVDDPLRIAERRDEEAHTFLERD